MVNIQGGPIVCIGVALGAAAGEVLVWCVGLVAGGTTVFVIAVFKRELGPIFGVGVAVGAFSGVVGERYVLAVAGLAFSCAVMVVAEQVPIGGVGMALLAIGGVVCGGNGRF